MDYTKSSVRQSNEPDRWFRIFFWDLSHWKEQKVLALHSEFYLDILDLSDAKLASDYSVAFHLRQAFHLELYINVNSNQIVRCPLWSKYIGEIDILNAICLIKNERTIASNRMLAISIKNGKESHMGF